MVIKIRFKALLTFCGDPIENGELVVENGKLVEILRHPVKNGDALDLSDCLLMPGFVNAHCHLSLTALGNKLNSSSFLDWIRELVPLNQVLDEKRRRQGIHSGAKEMKRSGVTALGDYISDPKFFEEIGELGFRSVLFFETLGFPSKQAQHVADKVKKILKQKNPPLCRFGVAPHAPYSVSPELFRLLGRLVKKNSKLLSCHVAETFEEVKFLNGESDSFEKFLNERSAWDPDWNPPCQSPVQYLNSLGLLEDLLAIHCNFVSADLDLMLEKNVSAVFCPKSTKWFGRQEFVPVRTLLDRGINVALGTDSLASNENLNFLDELRIADELLPDVNHEEILAMATISGGKALGLESGDMAPGQNADLIGFRIPSSFSGSWIDVPFEPHRLEVDFYMVDGRSPRQL